MKKPDIAAYQTVTHVHMLAALRAELARAPRTASIRVLDAGCGNEALIGYLHRCLQVLEPGLRVELFGFDISDPGVQKSSFLPAAIRELSVLDPAVSWEARVLSVTGCDPWPFESGFFDVVMHLPWVHWVAGHHERTTLIRRLSRLGLGKFREHRRKTGISLEDFASRHADFINLYTNYRSARELLRTLKACRLRASFAYTGGLFLHNLFSLAGRSYRLKHRAVATAGVARTTAFWFLKRLSSVTLRIEKLDAYRNHYV